MSGCILGTESCFEGGAYVVGFGGVIPSAEVESSMTNKSIEGLQQLFVQSNHNNHPKHGCKERP